MNKDDALNLFKMFDVLWNLRGFTNDECRSILSLFDHMDWDTAQEVAHKYHDLIEYCKCE